MALAAWSTSSTIARWKCATAPGYRVHPVIVSERTAVAGDVGELVEEGVVALLGGCVLAEKALGDHHAVLGEHRPQGVDDPGLFLTLGPFAFPGPPPRPSSSF
jgi:hypothetical protein